MNVSTNPSLHYPFIISFSLPLFSYFSLFLFGSTFFFPFLSFFYPSFLTTSCELEFEAFLFLHRMNFYGPKTFFSLRKTLPCFHLSLFLVLFYSFFCFSAASVTLTLPPHFSNSFFPEFNSCHKNPSFTLFHEIYANLKNLFFNFTFFDLTDIKTRD